MASYRIVDTAGSMLGIVDIEAPVEEGLTIHAGELGEFLVVEVYDDDEGTEGGVAATLVVDEA